MTLSWASTAFRRFMATELEDRDDRGSRLSRQKNVRVTHGESYRFHFRDAGTSRVGVENVDTEMYYVKKDTERLNRITDGFNL